MAIKKRPISPRQKMINLLYVVLMAMLALNVSTEVLEGFSVVEDILSAPLLALPSRIMHFTTCSRIS